MGTKGIIYFLQRSNGDIKIGTTIQYKTRHTQLISQHGDLTLLGVMNGTYADERQLHERFKTHRRGMSEFFAPHQELLQFIQEKTEVRIPESENPNKKRIFDLPDDLDKALVDYANERHMNLSTVIRLALKEKIERETGQKLEVELQWGGKRERED